MRLLFPLRPDAFEVSCHIQVTVGQALMKWLLIISLYLLFSILPCDSDDWKIIREDLDMNPSVYFRHKIYYLLVIFAMI